jgi:nitrogen fixation-related uncharacterized protein
MDLGAAIVLIVIVAVLLLLVGAMFVWAAVKDGQKDKAAQEGLGIRRRTRLGR